MRETIAQLEMITVVSVVNKVLQFVFGGLRIGLC